MDFELPDDISSNDAAAGLPESINSDDDAIMRSIEDCTVPDSISQDSDAPYLPSAISNSDASSQEGDDFACSAFDDADDLVEFEDGFLLEPEGQAVVPSPAVARLLTAKQDFAEIYSPPRIGAELLGRGKMAHLSFARLVSAWNL